ncbi:MAG: sulfatase [Planctomycetota bacterium]
MFSKLNTNSLVSWAALCVGISYVAFCGSAFCESNKVSRPNIVVVLCDDHRFDCMGTMGHPFLETPHMDQLATDGTLMTRAYVSTSLCSPSRASILTGLYAHNHRVVDNYHPVDPDLVFFPQKLQQTGYNTAFIGKWHMGGEIDDPQRGFDHWIAFKGQGTYWPDGHGTTREVPQTTYDGLNINGKRVDQKGYITDELTDYAVEWLEQLDTSEPFFLYVSHKGVHSDFVPADRHRGRYENEPLPIDVPTPSQMREAKAPTWVQNQRNSRHGADFGYNLHDFSPEVYYRRYCEALLSVDDSLGRLRETVDKIGATENTIFLYLGDNGFQFGDHGLIDKRVAYEASSRIPMIFAGPGIPADVKDDRLIGNIDVAPTLLAAAGTKLTQSKPIDGVSHWDSLGRPDKPRARQSMLYEYYWERNYPQTPTVHAVIGGRYKFIRSHGVWDREEFYDLAADADEMQNLILSENHQSLIEKHRDELWGLLKQTNGDSMPLLEDRGMTFPLRDAEETSQATFPSEFIVEP